MQAARSGLKVQMLTAPDPQQVCWLTSADASIRQRAAGIAEISFAGSSRLPSIRGVDHLIIMRQD